MNNARFNGPNGPHPIYGNALSGRPVVVDGVTFRPYRRGIGLYARCSDDFKLTVMGNFNRNTYAAYVEGVGHLGIAFRSDKTAMRAAIKASK